MSESESASPADLYGDLFDAVQRARLFADSKCFADAVPRVPPPAIVRAYRRAIQRADFNLARFVHEHFRLPPEPETAQPPRRGNVLEAIDATWDALARPPDKRDGSSLIALPFDYLVPGGRFREIYYWDSYFTMLGLAVDGRIDLMQAMIDNFAWLISTIGHVPNGNRSYYCSRSQPPCLALMVTLLARARRDKGIIERYRGTLLAEHAFWMTGSETLSDSGSATARAVCIGGGILNRYWDERDVPREESYAEDLALAAGRARPAALFREIRAACESGWDFSSRWLSDPTDPASLRTTEVIPVDLNCLLYYLEAVIARASARAGEHDTSRRFATLARDRANLLQACFHDPASGLFTDLLLPAGESSPMHSLATVYPLAFGLATDAQAEKVVSALVAHYQHPGGWITSPRKTGLQWDAPSGWAPLQWLAYRGLLRYRFNHLARQVARSWIDNVIACWRQSGVFLERYDVASPGRVPEGGEYPTQTGFGWTNGVLRALMDELGY